MNEDNGEAVFIAVSQPLNNHVEQALPPFPTLSSPRLEPGL